MKGISPEIDRLLWAVAESGSEQARMEFLQRYPTYQAELEKRASLVSGLKAKRPTPDQVVLRPQFKPRPEVKPTKRPYGNWVAGGFALAAVVALGYLGARAFSPPAPVTTQALPPPIQSQVDPPKVANPVEKSPNDAPQEAPENRKVTPPASDPSSVPPINDQMNPWQKSQDVKVASAPLQTVLQMVAIRGGMKLEIAPGMSNPTISYEAHSKNAVDIMKDLGHQYGFTPMLDGENTVIAIPAVDSLAAEHIDQTEPTKKIGP